MKEINDYIHEYDFPYHDFLMNFKDRIISNYLKLKSKNPYLTDMAIWDIPEIINFINPKLDKIVQDNYWCGKKYIERGLRTYVQNNTTSQSRLHNHMKSPGNISGVFYINIPKQGGEIRFSNGVDEGLIDWKPEANKLYLFPHWLLHTPLPQQDTDYRISFNWIYGGNKRPVHKLTTVQW